MDRQRGLSGCKGPGQSIPHDNGIAKLVRQTLSFLAAEIAVVILLILYPPFSSWLPGLLHR